MRQTNNTRTRILAGSFALILVVSAFAGSGGFALLGGLAPIGTASADIGSEGCKDDVVAFFVNPLVTVYSNVQDPCTDTQADDVSNLSNSSIYDEVLRIRQETEQSQRVSQSLVEDADSSKQPVRTDAMTKAVSYYANDSANATMQEWVNIARGHVNDVYYNAETSQTLYYNAHMKNAEDFYERLNETDDTEYIHIYVDGEELTSDNVTFQTGPISQDEIGNVTTGTTATYGDTTIDLATVTVDGTTYDYRDNLAITMTDPTGEGSEATIVGEDLIDEYGADAYEPEIAPEDADVVVAADGSGDTTSLSSAIDYDGSSTEDTIYVKAGEYGSGSTSYAYFAGNLTIYAESGAEFTDSFITDGGGSVVVYGGVWKDFSAASGGGPVEAHYVTVGDTQDGATAHNSLFTNAPPDSDDVDSVGYRFGSYTQNYIDLREDDRQEILTAFGNTSEGYLYETFNGLDVGAISYQDIIGWENVFQNTFSEDDVGSQAWLNMQYVRQNMGTFANATTTTDVTVSAGSSVFANAQNNGESVLSEEKTYSGHLWTKHPPASGEWETNVTYDTAELGGPVFVTYHTTETKTVDGELTSEVVAKTVSVKGEFQLDEIRTTNGTVENASHDMDTYEQTNDPYNASRLTDDINNNQETIRVIIQQADENDGDDGTSTTPEQCVFPTLNGALPCIQSFQISLIGAGLVILVGGYLFRPVMTMLANFSE